MTIEPSFSQDAPSILIVDDTPANLELLAEVLRERGFEPRPVPSGKLALAAAQANPPDLILLDIRMPEMDGFEVCERLKADEKTRDIPVIFITALNEVADKVKAFSMGAVDYVTKPFQAKEIEARMRTHLGIRSLQRQLLAQNEILERLVAERTNELARANEQLRGAGQLKDDFLRMISYEIRTPANGLLGIGDLILDLCPETEDLNRYSTLFHKSSLRLRNLIEDALWIANMEKAPLKRERAISFLALLDQVRTSLPDMQISMDLGGMQTVFLQGDRTLLKRALETMILLAAAFSRDQYAVHVTGAEEPLFLRIQFDLDVLSLSTQAVASFFEIESLSRVESSAETLGLAPVVAYKIITMLGGKMRLVKGDGKTGYLEAVLLKESENDQPSF